MSDLRELLSRQEELIPELQPHLHKRDFGWMIHHPLVMSVPHHPMQNALLNEQYRHKTKRLRELLEEGRYHSAIFLHERPYRLEKLLQYRDRGLIGIPFWKAASEVWIDSENIWQYWREWRRVWTCKDEGREAVMDDDEKARLYAMPEAFEVWRGVQYDAAARGMSWTLDKAKAQWFAQRWLQPKRGARPLLIYGRVRKRDVLALFTGRGESEIVSLKVKVTDTELLSFPSKSA